jgi:hypothetical protein
MNAGDNMKAVLLGGLISVLLLAGCKSEPSMSIVPSRTILEAAVRLPFDATLTNLPFVEATINGTPPRLFLVDTGSGGLVLSRRFLEETRPEFLGTTAIMETPSGDQNVGPMCHVKTLKIGPVEFQGVNACTADLSNIESVLNHELGGIIGMSVLADCRTTLDYPARTLLLEPVGTRWAPNGSAIVLPLKLSGSGVPCVPLVVHGTTTWAVVDSGSDEAFCLSYDVIERLGLTRDIIRTRDIGYTYHGDSAQREVKLRDSVFLGPREFLSPVVHVEASEPRMGHQILRRFIVTIDIRNKQIRFAHAPRT